MKKSILRVREVTCDQKLIHKNDQRTPLRVKNDATHAIQLILHERMHKKQDLVIVTSYCCNQNHDNEIKKDKEKANNSLSYRFATIKDNIM